jgi:uncharacterized protein YcgI (DUF1989 family)
MMGHKLSIPRGKDEIHGAIVEEIVVPARGSAAVVVSRGHVVRIVDAEGEQVPDVLLFDRSELRDQASIRYSLILNRKRNLSTGDAIFDLNCRKLATITADTVGHHWWGGAFCSEALNTAESGKPGMGGCRENLAQAMAPYGLDLADIHDGGCLNFFMSFHPEKGGEGADGIGPALSRAGDYVELRAERDLIVAISACPSTSSAVNAYHPTSIGVVVYRPSSPSPVRRGPAPSDPAAEPGHPPNPR